MKKSLDTRYAVKTWLLSLPSVLELGETLKDGDDAARVLRAMFAGEDSDQEHFAVLCLNCKQRIVAAKVMFSGGMSQTFIEPAAVFRCALLMGAKGIILGHNHPSGDPSPSADDLSLTTRLVQCGKLLGLPVLDHIIIGDGDKRISLSYLCK